MSNNTMNVPAHIAARIAARQKAGTTSSIADAISSGGLNIPRISLKGSKFRLVEDGVETVVGSELDVVIVGANPKVSKVFYAGVYDPAESAPPSCMSNDGVAPDESVEVPVCASCAACPNNVLGSKMLPSGAKSKLCADQRHLAVVAAADPTKVYSLTVPVSGMKALRVYFKELANYGIGPEEVVTLLGFDDAASFPKLVFSRKGYVPEKSLPQIDALVAGDEAKIATRQLPPSGAPALAAPRKGKALESAAEPTPPLVDDAYEDEAEALVISGAKTGKPTTKPVKASEELSSKLDTLFDE